MTTPEITGAILFNTDGLVPAIAQQHDAQRQ